MNTSPKACPMDEVTFLRRAADLLGSGRQMAELLDVNERTVSRWLNGDHRPQPGVLADVRQLLRDRAAAAAQLAEGEIQP